MRDRPYIEFNQGFAMQVWYDKPTDSYTLTNPIGNEGGNIRYVLQCKTIEFGRKEFKEAMMKRDELLQRISNNDE